MSASTVYHLGTPWPHWRIPTPYVLGGGSGLETGCWGGVCVRLGPSCCSWSALDGAVLGQGAGPACLLIWKVGIIPASLAHLQRQ